MLGKLIKYEFKATGRTMLPLIAAVLVLAALSGTAASMPESVVGALTDAYGEDGYAQGMASLGNVIAAANAAVTAKQQWQQVSADYDNAVSV